MISGHHHPFAVPRWVRTMLVSPVRLGGLPDARPREDAEESGVILSR